MPHDYQTERRTTEESTTAERLVWAILEHRPVSFAYHGLQRTVEPYLLGIHEAGEPLLLGYQTAGFSHSGELPGWRTFITTEIHNVELGDSHFECRKVDYEAMGQPMLEIFARA
jgi:predicted DNA-binding transcriptional regulator YafY